MRHYDAIIIGAGQAGPSLARRLAGAGMRVAVIERKSFGGTCVNTGCDPTKTMIASAYAAHMARRAAEYRVVIDGAVNVDMKVVNQPLHHRPVARSELENSRRTVHRPRPPIAIWQTDRGGRR